MSQPQPMPAPARIPNELPLPGFTNPPAIDHDWERRRLYQRDVKASAQRQVIALTLRLENESPLAATAP